MQQQILAELKELKAIMAQLLGTSELSRREQFSTEAVKKAAKEFEKMRIEREEWIDENDIGKYIRSAGWSAGKFIQTEFGFTACIKKGYRHLYRKKELIALGKELKERNVNLQRYIEYKRDKADFEKKLQTVNKGTAKGKSFNIPADLKDITTSAPPHPPVELIKQDLERLKQAFFEHKMAEYVDIYKGSHAMVKFWYNIEKYVEPAIKKRCKKWCEDFNYANNALELVTRKRETLVPVKEEEMIQL